jgi:ADP-heptose:LPS heptosyltransferase
LSENGSFACAELLILQTGALMKILVISLAGIGDTILATPLIQELRANFPEAQIDALVLWAGSKDVLKGNPHLNTIYQENLIKESKLKGLRFLQPLRRAGYDVSINTHPQSREHYRLTARFIAASTRISHEYDCWTPMDRLLVNNTIPQDYRLHTVENNLQLLPLLGAKTTLPKHELQVFLTDADRAWAKSFLLEHQLEKRRLLGIHVGSGGTKNLALKRWPLPRYLELVGHISKAWPDLGVLLFGGPDEEPELQQILAAHPSALVIRAKSQTLLQAAALMSKCTVFLSVDTALMHLAAAVKVAHQIVIEAPTFNKTNEPYGNPFSLVKNPAVGGRNLDYYRYDGRGIRGTRDELIRCMESISVEAVYSALDAALGKEA